jgi:Resolvase, N terminal domain
VRIFEDSGRSGLRMDGREGLQSLMREVQSNTAGFQAILVYDVSRWGRFAAVPREDLQPAVQPNESGLERPNSPTPRPVKRAATGASQPSAAIGRDAGPTAPGEAFSSACAVRH